MRFMPRRTTYILRWSDEQRCYEMAGGIPGSEIPQPTNPEWLAWLSTLSSFAFACRTGVHYTARQEKLQRGSSYWYGYRSHMGKTVKRYIGKTSDISIAQLESVAAQIAGEKLMVAKVPDRQAHAINDTLQSKTLTIQQSSSLSVKEGDSRSEWLTMQMMPLLASKLHPPH